MRLITTITKYVVFAAVTYCALVGVILIFSPASSPLQRLLGVLAVCAWFALGCLFYRTNCVIRRWIAQLDPKL